MNSLTVKPVRALTVHDLGMSLSPVLVQNVGGGNESTGASIESAVPPEPLSPLLLDPRYESVRKHVAEILAELAVAKVVLIKGAPATGKTLLLTMIAKAFELDKLDFSKYMPINNTKYIAPECRIRRSHKTVFHMNTKYNDFVCGIAASPSESGVAFKWASGPFYKAAEFARNNGHAALLIIDEINRGPTSAIFGDALVAIDADKRKGRPSQYPMLVTDAQGNQQDFYVPENLFVVAAMNEADASVQAMDLALLRRFSTYEIIPSEEVALDLAAESVALACSSVENEIKLLVRAWSRVNDRIGELKGHVYKLGHGIFAPTDTDESADEYICRVWRRIDSHVRELFFADHFGAVQVLQVEKDVGPYKLTDKELAERKIYRLTPPLGWSRGKVIEACVAASGSD